MNNHKPYYLILFILALVVNFIGINTGFFSEDPGLYASIAKAMVHRHDLLQLFSYHVDWLDKPHFPFWAVFVSFKLFGISVWAYRLPALLFFLMGLLYTYLFARRLYNTQIAVTAVLILMTAQHILLSNIDVRAEPYLTGLVIGSIYHIARLHHRYTLTDLLLAALFTACAVMTKGVFVIVAIYGALLGQLIFQNKFGHIFRAKWWLLFLATFIFTLPEIYALSIQFDLHPEKMVFGRQQVSGIRWFLWDSQFGRFVNSGPIMQQKSGDVFFFMHTLLWAFAPWCLFFYYALFRNIKDIIQKIKLAEYYTLSGGLLLLLLFSLSRFQLPFYTNIIFPLFSIITAPYFYRQLTRYGQRYWNMIQWIGVVLLPVITITLHIYLKPATNGWFIAGCLVFGGLALLISLKVSPLKQKALLLNCCAALFANFYMNTTFFDTLARYNGQIAAARYVNRQQFTGHQIYSVSASNNVFQFYCSKPVGFVPLDNLKAFTPAKGSIFFISGRSMDYLIHNHVDFNLIKAFQNYPQENILPSFINHATRRSVLNQVYLITK